MKTVCKKLFSLMLVAILLVSAVPFAASAAGAEAIVPGGGAGAIVPGGGAGAIVPGGGENEGNGEGAGAPATTYTIYLKIYVNEELKETVTETAGSEAEMLAWTEISAKDIADELGLSYDSVSGFWNTPGEGATSITCNVWITKADGAVGGGEDGGNIGDDNIVASVVLKTDYCGNISANVGDKYLDVLPTPAKPGQEFAYWYSENLGGIVKADSIIEAADTLTAYWKAPTKYTISFIDERGTEPDVVKMKQVSYGSAIGEMPVPAAREGYIFAGWKINGKYVKAETVYEWQGDVTAYAQWKLESDTEGEAMGGNTATANGEVYLEIYVNGDTSSVSKRVKITSLADDNKITQAEVEGIVKKYVTAKSGYTLKYEGLFDEQSWWEYTHDPETNGAKSIVVNRDGDDYVYVMVKNVKTVAADPTNPKTGDGIFAVMSVMMGSGAAVLSLNELRKRNKI